MAKVKKGGSSRKVKDKWKAKEWYKVRAPRMFNDIVIGDTPSANPENLIGRTAEVTVQDLTGDFSKMHIKLNFQVNEVDGYDAKTIFTGHDLTVDYVRRLTRRKKTKTDHVVDIVTSDGFGMRIKTMNIAENRIQASQEEAMRRAIGESIVQMGKEMTMAEIVKSIISGDMGRNVAKACRTIIPVKRVEIRKSEIRSRGTEEPESIIEQPIEENDEPEDEEPVEATVEESTEESEAEAKADAEEPEAAE